jgi:hypothetical protein
MWECCNNGLELCNEVPCRPVYLCFIIKTFYYVISYCIARFDRRGRYSLADQYLHSDGSENQKHSEYCRSHPCCVMAAAGVWRVRFFE